MKITARQSWKDSRDHYMHAMTDPWYKGLVDIQDSITRSTVGFASQNGLKNVHLPITTQSISSPMGLGSDSQPVEVNLFGIPTYLADSMQFMLEYSCRLHQQGCYYLMPSFRGEQADHTHLCQFYHSEAEIPGSLDDVIRFVEAYLRYMSSEVLWHCGSTIEAIAGDVSHVSGLVESSGGFPRVTMDEAEKLLGADSRLVHQCPGGGRALTRQGEQTLIGHFGGFVWLVDQDHMSVPFYQAYADPEGRTAKAADLLFGLGEVVGAGERHATASEVYAALTMHQVSPTAYDWYCKMREHFPMQTSGFGLGTERYICWLLQHNDVRDCQILPRFNGELTIP